MPTAERGAFHPRKKARYAASAYARLSREDGDRAESDSIINQQRVIQDYCALHPELQIVENYADDGFTGTNFDRPGFKKMLEDIKAGRIDCVIVKDLSRFGRDYIDMGYYLERVFPALRVRFIAINDGVDSEDGPYDMLLPLKNVFNAQYAKDISGKVRSAFAVKQSRGEFVGAFACYGYRKDPDVRNHLVVDPAAAKTVKRIFELAAQGVGQVRIAKILNEENIPCPSEYKHLMGERYTNGNRLPATRYWTYATIHRLLGNEMYLGSMVQRRSIRPAMHGKAKAVDKGEWIVVPNTHEPIISRELWDTVQAQRNKNTRSIDFDKNVGLLAGFIHCGDCGRSMVKTTWNGRVHYSCGSYRRYGVCACTKHYIPQADIEAILLDDLNRILAAAGDLRRLAEENQPVRAGAERSERAEARLTAALERVRRMKQNSYEDYQDKLLSREEFIRYKTDYDRQESVLLAQLEQLHAEASPQEPLRQPWVEQFLRLGRLTALDRPTLAQTVKDIRVFENRHLEITYLFSEELRSILEQTQSTTTATEGSDSG